MFHDQCGDFHTAAAMISVLQGNPFLSMTQTIAVSSLKASLHWCHAYMIFYKYPLAVSVSASSNDAHLTRDCESLASSFT